MRAFGDYVLLGELGRGGASVVWEARHLTIDRPCALKLLSEPSDSRRQPRTLARFLFEAEVLARLDHPAVVRVHAAGEVDGQRYIELELVEGGTLAEYLADGLPSARQAAQWAWQLAGGLAHAHGRGVLHRDIKPGNVLLTGDGRAKLTDFGLARDMEAPTAWTRTLGAIGTPAFMAPEVAREGMAAFCPRSDIYGLGAVLYQLLTGVPPHAGKDALEILERVRNQPPRRPRARQANLPPDLEVICLKCMDLEPSRRFQSAAEVAEELQRYLDGVPIRSRPAGPLRQALGWARRHALLAGSLGVTAGCFLTGFALVTWNWLRANRLADQLGANLTLAQIRSAQTERDAGNSLRALAELASAVRHDQQGLDSRLILEHWIQEGAYAPPPDRTWATGRPVIRASYSPDARRILAQLDQGEVVVYPAESTHALLRVGGIDPSRAILGFTDTALLTHQTHGWLRLWNLPPTGAAPAVDWELGNIRLGAVSAPPKHWAAVDVFGAVWFGTLASGDCPRRVATLPDSPQWTTLAVSPTEQRIVGAGPGPGWDLLEGDPGGAGPGAGLPWAHRVLPGDIPELEGLIFSPQGSNLLAFGGRRAELWHVASGRRKFWVPEPGSWTSGRFNSTGSRFLLSDREGRAFIVNSLARRSMVTESEARGARLIRSGEEGVSDARQVMLSEPSVTISAGGKLRFYPRTNEYRVGLAEHPGNISSLVAHPKLTHVLTACEDGKVREWRWPKDRWMPQLLPGPLPTSLAGALASTNRLLVLDATGPLWWDPSHGLDRAQRLPELGPVAPVPGPEPGSVVGVDQSRQRMVVCPPQGMAIPLSEQLPEPVQFLARDVSGRLVAGVGPTRVWPWRWDGRRWRRLEAIELPAAQRVVLSGPEGRLFALNGQGDVLSFDLGRRNPAGGKRLATGIRDLLLTGDGHALVLATAEGGLEGREVASPSTRTRRLPMGHPGGYLTVSPVDGRVAVAGPREVRLWDVHGRQRDVTLAGFEQPIVALAFSPDAEVLAVGTQAGQLRLFATRTGYPLTGFWEVGPVERAGGRLSLAFVPGESRHLVGRVSAGRWFRLALPRATGRWAGPGDPLLDLADYLAGRRLAEGGGWQNLTDPEVRALAARLVMARSEGRWDPGWDRYLPFRVEQLPTAVSPSLSPEP